MLKVSLEAVLKVSLEVVVMSLESAEDQLVLAEFVQFAVVVELAATAATTAGFGHWLVAQVPQLELVAVAAVVVVEAAAAAAVVVIVAVVAAAAVVIVAVAAAVAVLAVEL